MGYSYEDVIIMFKKMPAIISYSNKNRTERFNYLLSLGYQKEEVLYITKNCPDIYAYSDETLNEKIENIKSFGYTMESIIKMTKNFPMLYASSVENIKEKLEFYQSIRLTDFILKDTKNLMQSIDLSYARWEFFKYKKISIDNENYRLLFRDQGYFKRVFGFSNQGLIKMYNYDKYLEEQNNKNTL